MSKVEAQKFTILREKKTVISRAALWKIPHNSGIEDVRLKIGRYKKAMLATGSSFLIEEPESPEMGAPKSELTLDQEEFANLIKFLQDNYEPFKAGVKAYIPLDSPFELDSAKQIKALFSLPDKQQIVKFILENDVIPEQLRLGLEQARRVKAIGFFEKMLSGNLKENPWQKWFEKHNWVLGTEFVRVLDEKHIDTKNISDFLLQAYDGFLDIVEIKRPEGGMKFWSDTLDHGNHIPSSHLVKAIAQATKYIFEVEREANSSKFLESVGGVRVVKPRAVLIFGRSHEWSPSQKEAYRILNSSYSNLTILTYDHVLQRAKRIVGIAAK